MKRVQFVCTCLVGTLFSPCLHSQSSKSDKPIPKGRVASVLESAVDAAGPRFRSAGNERWSARVDVKNGKAATIVNGAQIVMEWPNKLSLTGPGLNAVFSGGAQKGNTDSTGFDLAEILLEDTIDGLLAASMSDGAIRVVGTGYPDLASPGGSVDLISVIMPSRTTKDRGNVVKQYWIDRKTRLLVQVVHGKDSASVRFSNWQEVEGNRFPGTIIVTQNGDVKYEITLTTDGVGAKQNDGLFSSN